MKAKHGDRIGMRVVTHRFKAPVTFQARNGEGLCEIPAVHEVPQETRFCATPGCGWLLLDGILAFFQADHVGCLRCGTPFPPSSWATRSKT